MIYQSVHYSVHSMHAENYTTFVLCLACSYHVTVHPHSLLIIFIVLSIAGYCLKHVEDLYLVMTSCEKKNFAYNGKKSQVDQSGNQTCTCCLD